MTTANPGINGFAICPDFKALVETRMTLGAERMMQCGNMYTAALPAWLAAGLVEAREQERDLAGRRWLDAALEEGYDLDRERYEALHDRRPDPFLEAWPKRGFVIESVGQAQAESFQDIGLEYYGSRG